MLRSLTGFFHYSRAITAGSGIEPRLEIREIDEQSFKANPSESNRIWIAGRPMEEWLGASVGSSRCCSVCGTSECRTVEVEGTTFEAIPEALFLRAALVAASQLLSVDRGMVTKVLIVTLAETTPVLEAQALREDLRKASIEPVLPRALLIN